ncbi:HMA2 domain-containing protein [Thermodesulfobacteriota bacterium]
MAVAESLKMSPILRLGGPVETVSNMPGRVRFRCSVLVGREDLKDLLSENLTRLPGLRSMEISEISGSCLIYYDPNQLTPELLFTALLKLLNLEEDFLRPGRSVLAKELRLLGESLNGGFYHMTGGLADLRTFLLVALGLFGVYKLVWDRAKPFPGGITLVWWAYDSLMSGNSGD